MAGVGAYKASIAPSPLDKSSKLVYEHFVRLGVHSQTIKRLGQQNLATAVAQYYGNVKEGMLVADVVHFFRGLERDLMDGDNEDGDQDVYVYSWTPRWDWFWDRTSQTPKNRPAPIERVFVVEARIFKSPVDGFVGEILHWTWLAEDAVAKSAPEDWKTRYAEHIWTKSK